MKPKLARILAITVALGALTLATEVSWSKGGGHGGGGHGGGGHAGAHGGGGHGGGGHGGGHWAGHTGGRYFTSGHHAHFGEARAAGSKQFASGHQFDHRSSVNRNAFGNRHEWNRFAHHGGWGGWGGGWGGWGGWVGPVFWPFLLGDIFSCAFWPYAYCFPFWSYGTALAYDYGPYAPGY